MIKSSEPEPTTNQLAIESLMKAEFLEYFLSVNTEDPFHETELKLMMKEREEEFTSFHKYKYSFQSFAYFLHQFHLDTLVTYFKAYKLCQYFRKLSILFEIKVKQSVAILKYFVESSNVTLLKIVEMNDDWMKNEF